MGLLDLSDASDMKRFDYCPFGRQDLDTDEGLKGFMPFAF